MEWLPEFALDHTEQQNINAGSAARALRNAAQRVYQTDKFKKRGEFGELLLHIAVRQVFGSIPAISKIYYKDSVNATVKGFDCVHIVDAPQSLELWLGEVKFYESAARAITDVVKELEAHTQHDYLRREFQLRSYQGKTTARVKPCREYSVVPFASFNGWTSSWSFASASGRVMLAHFPKVLARRCGIRTSRGEIR